MADSNSIALLVRPPEFDLATPLLVASRIQEAQTSNELAQMKLRQANRQQGALDTYRKSGNLEDLKGEPDIYAKYSEMMDADQQRKLLRNARDAQLLMGMPAEQRAQAWPGMLEAARREGRIDDATHTRLTQMGPNDLVLQNVRAMAAKIPTRLEEAQTEKALAEAAQARQKPTDVHKLGKDDVIGRMVQDQTAPGGARFVPLASNSSGGPGDPAVARQIQGGLDELNRIPSRYGGDKGVFTSAVGPFQGDESFNYGAGPIARAWGSLTAALGATGTNSSAAPAEVRRAISGGTAALAASIKPLIRKPGEGAWSDIDQAKLDSIVGNLMQASDETQYRRELNNVRQRINANFGLQLPEIGVPKQFNDRLPESQPSGRRTLNGKNYVKVNGQWFEE